MLPMKKFGIVIIVLLLLAGIGWAGATYVFSNGAEPIVDTLLTSANETTNDDLEMFVIEKTEYKKGFISSTATTSLFPSGKDVAEEDKIFLKHTIYHGPVALTPDGPKMCLAHTVSVVDWSNWEDADEEIKKYFGDKEPLTIHTTRNMDQTQTVSIEIPAFEAAEDETTGSFGGAIAKLTINPDQTEAVGEFTIEKASMKNSKGDDRGIMTLEPSKGTLDYIKGSALKIDIATGELSFDSLEEDVIFGSAVASIDYLKGKHYKASLKFGELDLKSTEEGKELDMELGGFILSGNFEQLREGSKIMVGKAEFRVPKLAMTSEEFTGSLEDLFWSVGTGSQEGKMFAEVRYGIGNFYTDDPSFAMVAPFLDGGASTAFGVRGIDEVVMESFAGEVEKIAEVAQKDKSKAAFEKLAPELAETLAQNLMDLFQPGLELFYEVKVGKKERGIDALLSIMMTGDKKLTELGSLREIINSIEGKLFADVDSTYLPDENTKMQLAQFAQMGMIKPKPDNEGYQFTGSLKDGAVFMAEQRTPLIDEMGPMLDEPIPWDEFMKGVRQGVKEGVDAASDGLKSKTDADGK